MKFRYLSSDFLASYDELIEQLETKQAEIDSIYEERIGELLERERVRLNQIVPQKYTIGDEVKIVGTNKKGKIVGTYIEFDTTIEELDDYGRPHYGPGRYFTIRNEKEEMITTCDGSFRMYVVESEPNVIESDWGHVSISENYSEDEIFGIDTEN